MGQRPLLIDTCGGFELVQQLAKVGYTLDDLEDVILTHRHGDHIGGVMALMLKDKPWAIYGHEDTLTGVQQLIQATFPEWERQESMLFSRVQTSHHYEIANCRVEFFEVKHRVTTLAVRVTHKTHTFAYSADSIPCQELIECARDVDLFVCDALAAETEGAQRKERVQQLMHPTALQAAQMASEAGVKALALVHLGGSVKPEAILREASEVFPGPVTVPDDGTRIQL
jgi:ribonuclease BN (tRNA processing enzyme)